MAGLFVLVLAALACRAGQPTLPPITWDTSPTALIVEALHNNGFPGGTGGDGFSENYIPHARLYGDGRIVWLQSDGTGGSPRVVMQGWLTVDQMDNLLGSFAEAGFFNWKAVYTSMLPYDNPPFDRLTVNLLSTSKSVQAIFGDGPEGYGDLFNQVSSGAGAVGEVFVPELGYLTVYPATDASGDPLPAWDAVRFGFELDPADDAFYIRGEALAFVWELVNQYPYSYALVEAQGQPLAVYLQIPGLSLAEPPVLSDVSEPPAVSTETPVPAGPASGSPVSGGVLIEDGRSAAGGTAGDTIDVSVSFNAVSTAADVSEMRVRTGGWCGTEADLAEIAWQPFVTELSYPFTLPINWVGYYVSVQYRDALGNLSPVYCDDISLEGMPAPPPP